MNLTRFPSLFDSNGASKNVLGHDVFWKPYSSFTGVLQVSQAETIQAHQGDCFSISTFDKDCFFLSVSETECFFIKSEEEPAPVPIPPPVITIPGFTSIKCVQAHGLNSIKVIGMYIAQGETEAVAVIADIFYFPSSQGGIGAVGGVYYYAPLSEIEKTVTLPATDLLPEREVQVPLEISDVVKLEGFDTTSGVSSLCIVTNDDVFWIDPLLFNDTHNTEGYTNKPLIDPYFEDDTFIDIVAPTYTEAIEDPTWSQKYRMVQWYTESILDNGKTRACGVGGEWSAHDDAADFLSDPDYADFRKQVSQLGILSYDTSYIKVKNQDDDTESTPTGQGSRCKNFHLSDESTKTIYGKRKDIAIWDSGFILGEVVTSAYPYLSFNYTLHTELTHDYCSSVGVWHDGLTTIQDEAVTIPNFIGAYNEAQKLAYDGEWGVCYNGGKTYYGNGTKNGEITTGLNMTLANGVVIEADGSDTLTQKVLIDEWEDAQP